MRKLSARSVVLAAAIISLPACKLIVSVSEGGRVTHQSDVEYCGAESTCIIDVVDTFFDERLVGNPLPGFIFAGWENGGLCAGNDQPCVLRTTGFDSSDVLLEWLESDLEVSIKADFRPLAMGTDCSDAEASMSLADVQSRLSGGFDFFAASSCQYASTVQNPLFEEMAIWTVGVSGTIDLIDDQTGFFGGQIRAGDLLIGISPTDSTLEKLRSGEEALVVYIDGDGLRETGLTMHGTLGSEYRSWYSFCFITPVPGGPELPDIGWLQSYTKAGEWDTVLATDGLAGGNFKYVSNFAMEGAGWMFFVLTGFSTLSFELPEYLAMHIEKLENDCDLSSTSRQREVGAVVDLL